MQSIQLWKNKKELTIEKEKQMSQKMSKFFKNLKKLLISKKRKLEFSKKCLKKYPTVLLHKKNDRFGFEFKFFIEDFLKAKGID